jgi:hypothetical protein
MNSGEYGAYIVDTLIRTTHTMKPLDDFYGHGLLQVYDHIVVDALEDAVESFFSFSRDVNDAHTYASDGVGETWRTRSVGFYRLVGPLLGTLRVVSNTNGYIRVLCYLLPLGMKRVYPRVARGSSRTVPAMYATPRPPRPVRTPH